ncbi:MAG TPA: DoxX family protein [Streptosporangiaceae bacterium]|nr:DoxX family protein [Streptosporangiaceae bacterium]
MFTALSLLLAAACVLPGSAKLLAHPKMRKAAAHFGIPWRGYRLLGVAELAAAAGVLVGLWWRPLGVAAGAGMVLLLTGALLTHRRARDAAKEAAPALVALAITIAYLAVAVTG